MNKGESVDILRDCLVPFADYIALLVHRSECILVTETVRFTIFTILSNYYKTNEAIMPLIKID